MKEYIYHLPGKRGDRGHQERRGTRDTRRRDRGDMESKGLRLQGKKRDWGHKKSEGNEEKRKAKGLRKRGKQKDWDWGHKESKGIANIWKDVDTKKEDRLRLARIDWTRRTRLWGGLKISIYNSSKKHSLPPCWCLVGGDGWPGRRPGPPGRPPHSPPHCWPSSPTPNSFYEQTGWLQNQN